MLVLATGASGAPPRDAEGPATGDAELFARLDADRDGRVAEDEASAQHRRLFERLVRGMIKRSDRDRDGRITRREAQGVLAQRFEKIDADGDNVLNRQEISAETERIQNRLSAADRRK